MGMLSHSSPTPSTSTTREESYFFNEVEHKSISILISLCGIRVPKMTKYKLNIVRKQMLKGENCTRKLIKFKVENWLFNHLRYNK